MTKQNKGDSALSRNWMPLGPNNRTWMPLAISPKEEHYNS